MERLLIALNALLYEGEENSILLVSTVEESADVAITLKGCPGQMYGSLFLVHKSNLRCDFLIVIITLNYCVE
jgi:hypothetical protein